MMKLKQILKEEKETKASIFSKNKNRKNINTAPASKNVNIPQSDEDDDEDELNNNVIDFNELSQIVQNPSNYVYLARPGNSSLLGSVYLQVPPQIIQKYQKAGIDIENLSENILRQFSNIVSQNSFAALQKNPSAVNAFQNSEGINKSSLFAGIHSGPVQGLNPSVQQTQQQMSQFKQAQQKNYQLHGKNDSSFDEFEQDDDIAKQYMNLENFFKR